MESSTSFAPHQSLSFYSIPNPKFPPKFISSQNLILKLNSPKHHHHHSISSSSLTTTTTTNICNKQNTTNDSNSHTHNQNHTFLDNTHSLAKPHKTNSRNSWWNELRAVVGQSVNLEGLSSAFGIVAKNRHLVVPHVVVPDIRYIDWVELKRRGFQGVVFDKDNTLTVPYSFTVSAPLRFSVQECKSVFGANIAVFSNSAGLLEYDPDGRIARALEFKIGIKVIKHTIKKPAGSAEEIEQHFGCESSRLIMVGDRPFTDIAYGNRNGFLTILTSPLSLDEEPYIVNQVRKLEITLVRRWSERGFHPSNHWLLPDSSECVIDHAPL